MKPAMIIVTGSHEAGIDDYVQAATELNYCYRQCTGLTMIIDTKGCEYFSIPLESGVCEGPYFSWNTPVFSWDTSVFT